jgi:hypothetical protein
MKRFNLFLGLLAAVLLCLGFGVTAQAFHDGGVAHCDGCHTMHNSEDGESIIDGGTVGITGQGLTKGTDPSSTCLVCHEGTGYYHVLSPTATITNLTPGGDFQWLKKTFTWMVRGNPVTRKGESFGHNVIAADYGLVQDSVLVVAPGSDNGFKSANLACSSCHDPHGKKVDKIGPIAESGSYGAQPTGTTDVGNFRLLADIGYMPGPGVQFNVRPPIAVTDRFSAGGETDSRHTDYGKGMSEWCATCHPKFLAGGKGEFKHPAANTATLGQLAGSAVTIADNYNAYVATGNLGNVIADAYDHLVPFERQIATTADLDASSTQGPNANSNVMCLTCHRAHVSAFPNSGRWDFETELLVDSHPKDTDGGAVAGDELASYYGSLIATRYNPEQRSLCNKCHIQD